jgi:hypothetical protein
VTLFHGLQLLLPLAALAISSRRWRRIARARGPEAAEDIARVASGGVYLLRGLGRVASPLALVGAIVEMSRGLAAAAGIAARVALERAAVSVGIGLGSAALCFAAASALGRRASRARAARDPEGASLDPPEAGV